MPIFKAIDRPGKSVKTVINYAAKDSKKEKDESLFYGVNCADNPAIAAYQMQKTKELYGKTDGRQYKHYVLSFAPGEITKDKAKIYAKELAEKCFGDHYEVAVGIHINSKGGKIHAHFVVNSVSFIDGRKLHFSKQDLENFKDINDSIAKQYGLKIIDRSREAVQARGRAQMYDRRAYYVFVNKTRDSWMAQCAVAVNQSLKSKPKSLDDFERQMQQSGWHTQMRGKNITFVNIQDKNKKVRANTLAKRLNNDILSTANIMRVCTMKNWRDYVQTPNIPINTTNITNITSAIKNLSRCDNSTSTNKGFDVNLRSRDDDYER